MNIEAKKLELIQLLLQTQKKSLLEKLKTVFEEEEMDWWSKMSNNEQEGIKTGLTQTDKGTFIADNTAMKGLDK